MFPLQSFRSLISPAHLRFLQEAVRPCIQVCLIRGFSTGQRKNPIDPRHADKVPVFQYASDKSTPDNRLYTWGRAEYGALGNREFVKPTTKGRKPIHLVKRAVRLGFGNRVKVTDLACGYGFTLFAASSDKIDAKIFGSGLNTDSQIGVHDPRKGHPLMMLAEPVPIRLPLQNNKTKIVSVAAGRGHSVVATDNEGVWSLGNNAYGQCGRPIVAHEDYSNNPTIHRIPEVDGTVKVVCGQDHSLFLLSDGTVKACGWGSDGQTGQGHNNIIWEPQPVVGDIKGEKIVKLSSRGDTVLAVSDKGEVFGWGNAEYDQMNMADKNIESHTARHLPLPGLGTIIDVAATGTACAIVNDDGQVFVWGFGILGKGPEVDHSKLPSEIPPTLFGRNELQPDVTVKQLGSGMSHFYAITNQGDLYTWGKNKGACLGLGDEKDQFFPLKVVLPAQVYMARCGVDHMVALCREII